MDVEYLTRVGCTAAYFTGKQGGTELDGGNLGRRGTKAYCSGIRRHLWPFSGKNIPAVIWSTLDDMCHTPNEYVVIDNLVRDTKIYLAALARYEE